MDASQILIKEHNIGVKEGCARALRVIGQALEDSHVNDFDLKSDGKNFVVHGETEAQSPALPRTKMKTLWESLQSRYVSAKGEDKNSPAARTSLDALYTYEDINRLDEEHKKRALAEQKPDPYGLPELLRLVGSYVDGKGHLVRVSRYGQQLTIHYVTERGETRIEDHDPASFYDFSVHLYLKRSARQRG